MKGSNNFVKALLGCLVLACLSGVVSGQVTSLSGSLANTSENPDASDTPLTSIVPGANNFTNQDIRYISLDPTGADIQSTHMSPLNLSYLTSPPAQINVFLRDVTFLTGILVVSNTDHPARNVLMESHLPITSTSSTTSLRPQANLQNRVTAPTTQWIAGMGTYALPGLSNQQSLPSVNISATNESRKDSSSHQGLQNGRPQTSLVVAGTRATLSPNSDKNPLESESPLETKINNDSQQTPFIDISQTSFLNTDIFSPTDPTPALKKQGRRYTTRRHTILHDQAGNEMSDQSDTPSALRKHKADLERHTRPKWHNPLLQQMENPAQ